MAIPARSKYEGDARRLLLAFDIGTTFSGISYSILDPGHVPEILPVTRFPAQENAGGDSKIPTVVYYDKTGVPCATGAETSKEGIEADVEEYGWTKAQWFKLRLCPSSSPASPSSMALPCGGSEDGGESLPPLPPNKTVAQVLSDYMEYLYECAKSYIKETHGGALWSTLESNILYVLTHPNGHVGNEGGTGKGRGRLDVLFLQIMSLRCLGTEVASITEENVGRRSLSSAIGIVEENDDPSHAALTL